MRVWTDVSVLAMKFDLTNGGCLRIFPEATSIYSGGGLQFSSAQPRTQVGISMNLASLPAPTSDRRRWATLVVVCLAQLMIVLDVTIVNVALPSIQHDLHISQADLTWVVNAFLVTFGSLMLLAGRLGDLVGRKRVFLAGLTIFTAASFLCGLAPS